MRSISYGTLGSSVLLGDMLTKTQNEIVLQSNCYLSLSAFAGARRILVCAMWIEGLVVLAGLGVRW